MDLGAETSEAFSLGAETSEAFSLGAETSEAFSLGAETSEAFSLEAETSEAFSEDFETSITLGGGAEVVVGRLVTSNLSKCFSKNRSTSFASTLQPLIFSVLSLNSSTNIILGWEMILFQASGITFEAIF